MFAMFVTYRPPVAASAVDREFRYIGKIDFVIFWIFDFLNMDFELFGEFFELPDPSRTNLNRFL